MKVLLLGVGKSNYGVMKVLDKHGISYECLEGENLGNIDFDILVKSPGIPYTNQALKEAIKLKKEVISDVELISRYEDKYYVAVSGSNGKTSTVTMLNNTINRRYKSIACGNIGYSLGEAIVANEDAKIFCVECSSFQLKGVTSFKPKISVLLNVEPCHLDYHGDYADYIYSKGNITRYQDESDYFIYSYDSLYAKKIAAHTKAKAISFSTTSLLADCYVVGKSIYFKNDRITGIPKRFQKNKHLLANYLAVFCCMKVLKLKGYRKVFKEKNVLFRATKVAKNIYNDAKSTNPYATITSLLRFNKISLICGGYSRGESLYVLIPYLRRIKRVYTYGETSEKVRKFMDNHNILVTQFSDLSSAALVALKELNPTDTLLYSPMFASYDQYHDYSERGREFNFIVKKHLEEK